LQNTVNELLQLNKDILIHISNLAGYNNGNPGSPEYDFYILYTSTGNQKEELKEMAAAVTQEQSVEVKEMNPEIMKPSS